MNILLTGCAGFIASKVCGLLLKTNNTVIGIDKNFFFKKLDITDLNQIEKVFKKNNFNAIINLAARAGVRYSVENPWIYMDTNIIGTLNLLELCRKYNIKKFILASTSSIYGEADLPFIEDKKTDYPLSPYAASKKGAEAICYTYHYLYGIDISIPRYFTVYGPAGRPDMSYFIFTKKIKDGAEITVFGDGNQERDFTYIDDIAIGTIATLKLRGFQIINLGNDHPIKLKYIIKLIEDILEKKAKIKYLPRHPADVTATWANIDKAKNILSWNPKINIEEGIRKTVNWFEENWEWVKEMKV